MSVITDIAASVLAWCGVNDPAPADTAIAEMAAASAVSTIKFYRGLAETDEFETGYTQLATEMAVYAYSKRGVDGAVSFSENGMSHTYENGTYPPSLLARINLPTKNAG